MASGSSWSVPVAAMVPATALSVGPDGVLTDLSCLTARTFCRGGGPPVPPKALPVAGAVAAPQGEGQPAKTHQEDAAHGGEQAEDADAGALVRDDDGGGLAGLDRRGDRLGPAGFGLGGGGGRRAGGGGGGRDRNAGGCRHYHGS